MPLYQYFHSIDGETEAQMETGFAKGQRKRFGGRIRIPDPSFWPTADPARLSVCFIGSDTIHLYHSCKQQRVTRLHGKAEEGREHVRSPHLGVLESEVAQSQPFWLPQKLTQSFRDSAASAQHSLRAEHRADKGGIVHGPGNHGLLCCSASLFSSMKWEQSQSQSHRALVG